MKKCMMTIALMLGLAFAFSAASAQSGNANSLENRAKAATNQCWQPLWAPHCDIIVDLVAQGRCLDGGTLNTYRVTVVYNCPPNLQILCLTIAPIVAGYVTFDCNNEISSVTCGE